MQSLVRSSYSFTYIKGAFILQAKLASLMVFNVDV